MVQLNTGLISDERYPASTKVFWQISLLNFVFVKSVAIRSAWFFSFGKNTQRIE